MPNDFMTYAAVGDSISNTYEISSKITCSQLYAVPLMFLYVNNIFQIIPAYGALSAS